MCSLPDSDAYGLALTPSYHLIVALRQWHVLIRVDPRTGKSEPLAGSAVAGAGYWDGPPLSARFASPCGLLLLEDSRCVVVCDRDNRLAI